MYHQNIILMHAIIFIFFHLLVIDRAKVTINGLYKVIHGLSIAAKMHNLE